MVGLTFSKGRKMSSIIMFDVTAYQTRVITLESFCLFFDGGPLTPPWKVLLFAINYLAGAESRFQLATCHQDTKNFCPDGFASTANDFRKVRKWIRSQKLKFIAPKMKLFFPQGHHHNSAPCCTKRTSLLIETEKEPPKSQKDAHKFTPPGLL